MSRRFLQYICLAVAVAVLSSGGATAQAAPYTAPGYTPDYYETPNWANSPPLRKFVDTLPGLNAGAKNNLGQYLPVAIPDTTSYPGSDYYELELGEYTEKMHSDLPPTTLRGYRQVNTTDPNVSSFHYLGPLIMATKDRPVRVKFINRLPNGSAGNLFLPVDTTVMGSGEGPNCTPVDPADPMGPQNCEMYTQNRADLHLHGGRTPWISDGTPHQWITPAGEATSYKKGVSVVNVPDMWFKADGTMITEATFPGSACAGSTTCAEPGATNDPGDGSQTYYWTNQQSARLMFYHDHSMGITRLNVYAGEAAGYLLQDDVELALVNGGTVNGRTFKAGTIPADQIPLVIQDKTFVDGDPASPTYVKKTDPLWNWGTGPLAGTPNAKGVYERTAKTGDLWWPHVYMPAENPFNPDLSGMSGFGRWFYGPWFYPATPVCGVDGAQLPLCVAQGPVANPYYDPTCDPAVAGFCQPPLIPGTPDTSWGAEAFLDTMVVNGTAYPKLTVDPKPYRLRILNAAHDRFLNLQLYQADASVPKGCPTCADLTEVKMVPALEMPAYPNWPADAREGGVPDPALRGPAFIQVGSEGGLLPAPVVLPNQPVSWNLDPTTFNFGNVNGGTLIMGPAERADVIVDFSKYAGKTLILYNDAPTAFPALVPQYNYYTGAPDRTDMGGIAGTPVGFGPNIRTVMQITVTGSGGSAPPDDYNPAMLTELQNAFKTTPTEAGAFSLSQEPVIVGQTAYNQTYNKLFPANWPTWGVSRITDTSISFKQPDGTLMENFAMKPKAIHDEMGASFDEFGRMAAKLGLELPFTNAGNANFVLQNYADPVTEQLTPGGIQVWKISHNGVDTHPIHFHLFDVQILNRVAWDGIIRLPDANELGWKDTIRVSPLEDTIVALRPITPRVPFPLPDSVRPLNPTVPIGSDMGFSQSNPKDGGNLGGAMVNQLYNFGHEYVWHCHILSHEENDMMRSMSFLVPPLAPATLTAANNGPNVDLSFKDNSASESSFEVQISNDPTFLAGVSTRMVAASVPAAKFGDTMTLSVAPALGSYYRVQALDDYTPTTPPSYRPDWQAATSRSSWSNIATVAAIPIALSSPASLAFGDQPYGSVSAAKTITLTNGGRSDLTVTSVALAGANPGEFAVTANNCVATLAPAAGCSISVTFNPTVAAAANASLTINSDDPARPALSVPVTGTGIASALATLNPLQLIFDPQLVATTSAAKTISLANTGNQDLGVSAIRLTGGTVADFSVSHDCPVTLVPAASCTISVTATPSLAGTVLADLAIDTTSPAASTAIVPLSVIGTAPIAVANPTSLNFANQFAKSASAARQVVISNAGTAPLVVSGIGFAGANPGDFSQSSNCAGGPIAVGASCTVNVVFTPQAMGNRAANLAVATSDPVTPLVNVALAGTGVAPVGSVAPASLSYGNVLVNTSSLPQTVTVSNQSSTTALQISAITLTGTDPTHFSLTSSCGSTVAPGGSCSVAISFTPLAEGAKSAALTVVSNDPFNGTPAGTFSVPLTGLGTTITLSSQALYFGAQVVNNNSSKQIVSILNTSDLPMAVSDIAMGGVNPGDFTQTNGCPPTLVGGESCTINIKFRPTAPGPRSATLYIYDSAAGSPQSIPISGTGMSGPAAGVNPTSINFGSVTRGSTSVPQTIALTSTGGVPLLVSSISLSGTAAADFTLVNNDCPIGGAGLPAGASCTVSVSFAPSRTTGTRNARVSFTDNANNNTSTQSVTLVGVAQ
ncbi:choice-of-anchor D domain-containing protein [Geomonas anaerohicana]|uniref:Choice-of-anchor D domain-containing protein n=1 Tax=Geomonas anaerohicana TaxID=2798583 RepID=A0ABS0YDD9_9BACT|nr:choice-of-anchor D domain-containing protein [Geomonas anaerohicana]MBJ6750324.1 choice-of-anchor D domain-containing protein [Geomonas anaerohicana]